MLGRLVCLGCLLSLLPVGSALAKEKSSGKASEKRDKPQPWAVGVSDKDQARALAIFRQGNVQFQKERYNKALSEYDNAVAIWDHPAIHFNMAVCLINLDRPIKAHSHLARAMEHGEAPLGETLHSQGKTFQKLLDGRLHKLAVKTEQAGTVIALDGKDVLTGPGSTEIVLLPGSHQLVAQKVGLRTVTRKLRLDAGQRSTQTVQLSARNANRTFKRRWKTWVPWAVVGSGAAFGIVGLGFHTAAQSNYDKFEAFVSEKCPCGPGLGDDHQLTDEAIANNKRGNRWRNAEIATFAVSGALIATGLTMVVLNQPRALETNRINVQPVIGPSGASVSVSLTF